VELTFERLCQAPSPRRMNGQLHLRVCVSVSVSVSMSYAHMCAICLHTFVYACIRLYMPTHSRPSCNDYHLSL
jgi:hypothetical protein